jgi:transposase
VVTAVRQEPAQYDCPQARWRLIDLLERIEGLHGYSRSGVCRLLHRLGLHLKRGRLRLHSPDPAYEAKRDAVAAALAQARAHPAAQTLLFGDEASCHRQPTLADRWYPDGEEPTAPLSPHANTRHRVCAGLDAVTGQVVWTSASKTSIPHLIRWLERVRTTYPDRAITLVWDNWPVHAHPRVRAAADRLQIRILWLPTYAPWLNPIEKLWRWLKQTVLHHHRLADHWDELVAAIQAFLNRFTEPSSDLLRYTGLLPD